MSEIDLLAEANPTPADPKWGDSEAGRALLASVMDRIENEVVVEPVTIRRRPWIYAAAAFVVTLLAALPLMLSGVEGFTADSGPIFDSAEEVESILEDNFVSDEEVELAADTTVQCVIDAGGDAYWRYGPNGYSIDVVTNEAGRAFYPECEGRYLRQVQFVWAAQHDASPEEGFLFYSAIVRCTEATTGQDFGDLTQDSLGFMSSEGHRTINAALNTERAVYMSCFDEVAASTPTYFYFVLECVTEATGDEYENPVDAGSGRLTPSHLLTLRDARLEHPAEFDRCMGDVAID